MANDPVSILKIKARMVTHDKDSFPKAVCWALMGTNPFIRTLRADVD